MPSTWPLKQKDKVVVPRASDWDLWSRDQSFPLPLALGTSSEQKARLSIRSSWAAFLKSWKAGHDRPLYHIGKIHKRRWSERASTVAVDTPLSTSSVAGCFRKRKPCTFPTFRPIRLELKRVSLLRFPQRREKDVTGNCRDLSQHSFMGYEKAPGLAILATDK